MRAALALLALGLGATSTPASSAVLPDGDCAGVYWDLTAEFATGDRLYARVLVTRSGPGDENAAALGHWIDPDGTKTAFQNGRSKGDFELAPRGDRIRIGSSLLELGERTRFAVDNDKRGVKIAVGLEPGSSVAPVPVFDGDPEVSALHLGSAARATVWRRGMARPRSLTGSATLVQTRHRACEPDVAPWRADVHVLGREAAALLVYQSLADGGEQSWLGWRSRGGGVESLRPELVAMENWRPGSDGSAIPGRLRPKAPGISGEISIGPARLSIDPLDALPRIVRMLYWFGAKPRRVWADATSEIASSRSESLPRGPAIASFTFLRPPDDPPRPPETGG